jgi:hypothetical protein
MGKLRNFFDSLPSWAIYPVALLYLCWRVIMVAAGVWVIFYAFSASSPDYENPNSSVSFFLTLAVGAGLICSPSLTLFIVAAYVALIAVWFGAAFFGAAYVGKYFGGLGAGIAFLLILISPLMFISLSETLANFHRRLKSQKEEKGKDQSSN